MRTKNASTFIFWEDQLKESFDLKLIPRTQICLFAISLIQIWLKGLDEGLTVKNVGNSLSPKQLDMSKLLFLRLSIQSQTLLDD